MGGLSAFHLYLSGTNQTTYEHFRHRHSDAGNPYNIGCLGNFHSVFCIPVPTRADLPNLASRAPDEGVTPPYPPSKAEETIAPS